MTATRRIRTIVCAVLMFASAAAVRASRPIGADGMRCADETPALPPDTTRPTLPPAARTDVMLQVKANALWAVVGTLNVGVEVQVDPKCSIDIPVTYSPYDMGHRRKWRILSMQPEVRWWWQRRAGEGQYAGLHLSLAGFNVAFRGTDRYQDPQVPAVGLGLGYGYAFPLGKGRRWWMDCGVGVGFIHYRFDKYDNAANGQRTGSGSGTYWGVTRATVGIAYRWTWKHRQKGGEPRTPFAIACTPLQPSSPRCWPYFALRRATPPSTNIPTRASSAATSRCGCPTRSPSPTTPPSPSPSRAAVPRRCRHSSPTACATWSTCTALRTTAPSAARRRSTTPSSRPPSRPKARSFTCVCCRARTASSCGPTMCCSSRKTRSTTMPPTSTRSSSCTPPTAPIRATRPGAMPSRGRPTAPSCPKRAARPWPRWNARWHATAL